MQKEILSHEERKLHYSSFAPKQFLILCKLTEVNPEIVLHDFMLNVGMENRGLGKQQRFQAMEYFISCGYGEQFYTKDEIRKIMKELEAISSLFPDGAESDLIDLHSRWRSRYEYYWFQKWFKKVRRKQ